MKVLFLIAAMVSISVWAEDGEEQEMEITDQQRCEEWAVMDGIAKEDLSDYMRECISSLGYEGEMGEESAE